jgi:type I restriction enzyme, S subunit
MTLFAKSPWPLKTMGDVCAKKEQADPASKPDDLFTYVDIASVSNQLLAIETPKLLMGREAPSRARKRIRTQDVILATTRPYLKSIAMVPESLDGEVCSTGFCVLRATESVLPEWLFFCAVSDAFIGQLTSKMRGANYPAVSDRDVYAATIPVPSLDEQRRIVGRIKECMERIDEVRELRAEGLKEANALFFSTAYEKYQRLCREEKTKALSELVVAMGGGTPSKKNEAFWKGTTPWVSPKDMKTWQVFDAKDHITEEAIAGSSTKMVPAGAVLMVVRGMILAHSLPIALARVPLTINQDMKALIAGKRVIPEYIAYMLVGAKPILLDKVLVAGHGTRRLLTETWSHLPIPVPPLDVQEAVVDELDAVRATAAEMVATFGAYKTDHEQITGAVLRKAFAGKL